MTHRVQIPLALFKHLCRQPLSQSDRDQLVTFLRAEAVHLRREADKDWEAHHKTISTDKHGIAARMSTLATGLEEYSLDSLG